MLEILKHRWLPLLGGGSLLLVCVYGWLAGFSARVDRNRVWTVGTDNTLPYHAYLAQGDAAPRPTGIAAELMDTAAKRLGIRLKWVVMPAAGLAAGKADLWPLNTEHSRPSEPIRVTRPILRHAFVALSQQADWYHSTAKPRLATRPFLIANGLKQLYPKADFITSYSRLEGLIALCEGKVDALMLEARPIQALLLNRPRVCDGVRLHAEGQPVLGRELGFGSTVAAAPVAALLRDEIDRMIEDGTAHKIIAAWSYYSSGDLDLIYREEQARRATQAANSLTGLLLVLLVALTWFYLQARKAQRQAIEANQAKTDFLANISHEIRTPLNGILGLTEVLESSQLDSRQRGLLKSLRDSGRNLLAIVNDLLDLALVARGKFTLKPEPVALKDLLEGAAQPFQLAAEAKKLQFEMIGTGSLPAFVRADPVRMRQIVSNLIGNAVKFTDHGSVIVRVHWSSGQNRLRLSVEDTGIGMSEAAQARLFEKFYQADSSISRRFGGTGLGLAIVKEMVTAMDGSIAVESQQGSGSKFLIELPLEAVAGAAGEPPPAAGPAPRSEKARVLVVEDNEVNQLVVRSLLAMAGHEVDCAHDGVQGLEAWKLKPYDLVLMDCQMPNLDGYQATSLIRQIEGTERRTPIVALTASAMPGDRERCYEAGMDDFLSKPVHAAELQRVLNAWVKKETQIPVSQH